jgi:hypothetical protein
VQLQSAKDAPAVTVFDLTADRSPRFAESIRFADIDGDGNAELVAYSCLTEDKCKKTWLYRLNPAGTNFVGFFSFSYEKLWSNDRYFVTQSSFADDEVGYQVFLTRPPKKPELPAGPDDDNPVTWGNGLLYYVAFNPGTGTCSAQFLHPGRGDMNVAATVPDELKRLCTAKFEAL